MTQLTPMMKQYMEIKNRHKDKILFFRLGDFYEMFFDDALTASKVLDITLTGRDCGLKERAPMCGIPYHAAEPYIAKLIENDYKVAICEQIEDAELSKNIVKRDVVKIITPGTVTSSIMLDENTNNYLMSINKMNENIGIAYVDLSTGEFFSTYANLTQKDLIKSEVHRINPKEIIVSEDCDEYNNYSENTTLFSNKYYDLIRCKDRIEEQFNVVNLEGLGIKRDVTTTACGSLLFYLDEVHKGALKNINRIRLYNITNYMILDESTRRNLELSETIRGRSKKGALLSVIDKTSTSMGSRKLKQWVERPLLNKEDICNRLDSVEELYNHYVIRQQLKDYLKDIQDIERLGSRIALGNANARDLIHFKNSIVNLPKIKSLLESFKSNNLKRIRKDFDELKDLYNLVDLSINMDPPFSLKEGNIIKSGYNKEIDKYRQASKSGKQWIMDLERKEKEDTGIKSLKIGYNKIFGYYIEITRTNINSVPKHYIRKQTLVNSERYIIPELKELEEKVLYADEKLIELEYQIFIKIREEIALHIKRIQNTSELLSEIDCLCSFAEIAQANSYVKPEINDSDIIEIKDGRHPVVEKQDMESSFVPNDAFIDCDKNRLLIVTGPNMAGKSTYMRQNALVVLLAQIGSFVPASYAKIGIVDRIFTRVGASDDLASGQSTFMVEMMELSNIINSSTKNSLIILDEIGRGTSTFDGLSIAWATVEYISDKKRLGAKTMFATHYHELTELENKLEGVKNYYIAIEEKGKDIIFLRKIKRGAISGSYGIHVARLAGIPEGILARALEILDALEAKEKKDRISSKKKNEKADIKKETEVNLFNYKHFDIINDIKKIDIENTTPIQALNLISELKERTKNVLS